MDEKTISVALTEDDWYLLLRTLAAVDFFEMLADHLETLTAAVEAMNYREEMCECGEDY